MLKARSESTKAISGEGGYISFSPQVVRRLFVKPCGMQVTIKATSGVNTKRTSERRASHSGGVSNMKMRYNKVNSYENLHAERQHKFRRDYVASVSKHRQFLQWDLDAG